MIDEKKLIEELRKSNLHHASNSREEVLLDRTIRIVKEQPKVGEWIPVEEGLPKKHNSFYEINLVTLENGHVCFGVYRYDSNEWWTRMSEGETVYSNKHKVIAWMPLPEPYRKERSNKNVY